MKTEKNALMVASVASMIHMFNMKNIEELQKQGFMVSVAANFQFGSTSSYECIESLKKELTEKNCKIYDLPIARNVFDFRNNKKAFKKLKEIIERESFSIIHCHSPIGGVLTRLAAKNEKRTKRVSVIYTAHGFHFYKGAPLKNWLLYYPIEKHLSKYTDVLITINLEDYERAKRKFKAKKIEYVPGVGIDINKFQSVSVDREKKRAELGIPKDAYVMLSVGELNENKNHSTVIRALKSVNNPNITYIICGQGPLEEKLKDLIKELDLSSQVKLLGYRSDIPEILKASDLFVFPSRREGLSVSLMEAMMSGLPIVCSKIRGNTDLVEEGKGGYLVTPNDIEGFASAIETMVNNNERAKRFVKYNTIRVVEFSDEKVLERMARIYKSC